VTATVPSALADEKVLSAIGGQFNPKFNLRKVFSLLRKNDRF